MYSDCANLLRSAAGCAAGAAGDTGSQLSFFSLSLGRISIMNEQLDKLESSVARLVEAYNALKQENEKLKAELADKTAAVDLLQEESQTVRTRIDALVASLNPENA